MAQVQFDSVEAEVNFVALLTLVGVGGGFRALLHNHTGEGAHGVATRALLEAICVLHLRHKLTSNGTFFCLKPTARPT